MVAVLLGGTSNSDSTENVPVNNEVQTSALKPTQTLRHRVTDWSLDGMLLIADRGITSTG